MAVETQRPNADGNLNQWTPLSGANYTNVDEATADDDTTYVKTPSGGFGTRDEVYDFDWSNIPNDATIDQIKVTYRARLGPNGTADTDVIRALMRDGILNHTGTQENPTTTYATYSHTYTTNLPTDGSDLKNNYYFGARATSNNLGDDDLRLTWVEVEVTYTPNTSKTHTTDALLQATTTKTHTSDGLLIPTGKYYSREVKATLPTNNAILATLYTSGEYSDVDADDNVYVDLTGTGNLVHQFVRWNDNNTEEISISVKAKTTLAPTVRTVYLQIYNQNSGAWETLDSDNTTAADTEFTLTGSQTTNLSNYYSSGFASYFRIYQDTA